MARKRIVFVIVEGRSDEEALAIILNRFFSNETVYVHILHRDITTEKGNAPSNILSKLGEEIKGYANKNHYKSMHFKEIIHIVDMDGVFVPDDCIVEDKAASKFIYSEKCIKVACPKAAMQRNRQKRDNLNRLCACKTVWNIPYRVFYMSCNLDHVLYNKLNCTDAEKEMDSYAFAKKYKEDIPGFLNFICKSGFSVMAGYSQSWQYIKEELRSLERHTNFGLCFEQDSQDG